MTTSTTALRAAIGAVLAALLVVLFTPTAAFAAHVTVSAGSVTVKDTEVTTTATVTNIAPPAKNVRVTVSAAGEAASFVDVKVASGKGCKGSGTTASCGNMKMQKTKNFKVVVTPKGGLDEGQMKAGKLVFKVAGPNSGGGQTTLGVEGYAQTSPGIKGTVTDLDNGEKPLAGVKITAKDDAGNSYGPEETDDSGNFTITGEIPAESVITWKATKDKYDDKTGETTATAGTHVTISVRMEKKPAGESEPAKQKADDSGEDEPKDEGDFTAITWVLIVLGILLVAGGVFAIWMLLRKGKNDDDKLNSEPDEPPTHQFSASQTGRHGIYEGSGPRPGMDNPTMIHQGPLVNDEDLARYGSEPPSSGFGPAYGDARPTQMVDSPRGEPQSGATQRYPSPGHEPRSGSTQMYPREPQSGATQRYPASGHEPRSGSTPAYPSPGHESHREPPSSGGRRYRDEWGGYNEQQPGRSSGRRYRDDGYDEYDDRPRSW